MNIIKEKIERLHGRTEAVGQNQIEHFLSKADPGHPLIKTTSKTVLFAHSANTFINDMDKLRGQFESLDIKAPIQWIAKTEDGYRIRFKGSSIRVDKKTMKSLLKAKKPIPHLLARSIQFHNQGLIDEKQFEENQKFFAEITDFIDSTRKRLKRLK